MDSDSAKQYHLKYIKAYDRVIAFYARQHTASVCSVHQSGCQPTRKVSFEQWGDK